MWGRILNELTPAVMKCIVMNVHYVKGTLRTILWTPQDSRVLLTYILAERQEKTGIEILSNASLYTCRLRLMLLCMRAADEKDDGIMKKPRFTIDSSSSSVLMMIPMD